jgi:hypothetical protein
VIGTPITVTMGLGKAAMNTAPRRHSFDERILSLNNTPFEVRIYVDCGILIYPERLGIARTSTFRAKVLRLQIFHILEMFYTSAINSFRVIIALNFS